jgi:branched-chain amino acid aminotransferase
MTFDREIHFKLVGTQKAIGIGPPNEALLFVILSPVGPYYPRGFQPISLHGTTEFVRAAPGGKSFFLSASRKGVLFSIGTGAFKLGSNYAPGVVPQKMAAMKGYEQNLWLLGDDHLLTEVGTMNIFVVFRKSADSEFSPNHLFSDP